MLVGVGGCAFGVLAVGMLGLVGAMDGVGGAAVGISAGFSGRQLVSSMPMSAMANQQRFKQVFIMVAP